MQALKRNLLAKSLSIIPDKDKRWPFEASLALVITYLSENIS